nr:TetR family transcriptional regulator [Spirochaetaceae bacterium]
MPKTGMEPVRTKQVINAVLKCVADEGIDQVTLEKTAKMAGVSKGVVTYYFNNKEKLLIQSFKTFLTGYLEMIELGISSYLSEISSREMLL